MDRHYIISGVYSNSYEHYPSDWMGLGGILMKINTNGNIIWQKNLRYETSENGYSDLVETTDSSIVVTGFPNNSSGASLIKFSSTGELIWQRTYDYNPDPNLSEELYKVQQTQDEGFVMCGFAHTIVDVPVSSASNTWILKVDKYGCEIPLCVTSIEEPTQPEPPKEETYFEVYPNPSSGVVNVEWNPSVGSGLLEAFNLSGVLVLHQEVALVKGLEVLALEDVAAGVYFVRLRSAEGIWVSKVVLE
jgi:hypothetical protein